ncbi:N-acetyl-gamma-glutamyl-phosphate reductase [Corynebacterium sp. 320]|uniref:N-acetyl-gamma-glutamyl-phosphate reductase n=1 Tax=Corynebacterium zhongnanshanii TaxID=2768834 RepID=A0ABQ6VCU6_9CORY|nr:MULTISPECIES: N-acetyl-gamma-glutamyl-phosphate reductase [Corynebacterium]KAB1502577.1 N-acetyl-gamma-glutamyl-phosphate reductase [Corynebacterium sp. 320]KAB3520740.1 N-acetyl-gamma-glutamyl-phosphate reductase [Corynebacterium zhongnanshanii]KAB3526184.1 N-acetyl-gamma-glutamyl-phosphate reductase [Corynebacterium sp. 250]MCR5914351.1 N-acetyl-gamma-glutamyl-phosphate reductase [Corynebacterium sp. zg254]QNP92918.1 N-acetyl-gamma-glutamyl-phosphate reductase [Corynebacterium zhongnansha
MLTIAIAGATGYAGGEALRLLLNHPGYTKDFQIGPLTGASNAGARFGDLVPSLPPLAERVVENTTPEVLATADVAILALPHGVSAALAAELPESVKVIDCGADFRLKSQADWEKYYGTEYAGHETYGIPEMPGHREAIKTSRFVAAPGCFPTGATLAALPGIHAGVMEPQVSVVSVTGVSGAGKKAAVNLLGAETMGNLRAYGVGTHRHTPEITQNLAEVAPAENTDVHVTFTPVLAPLTRGILTTVTARTQASAQEVRAAYEAFCADEPFLHLLPEGQQPETKNVVGSNMVHLQVTVNDGMIVATSAIDNLTKGTAGAVVQCLNLMMGWDETAGLPQTGM